MLLGVFFLWLAAVSFGAETSPYHPTNTFLMIGAAGKGDYDAVVYYLGHERQFNFILHGAVLQAAKSGHLEMNSAQMVGVIGWARPD